MLSILLSVVLVSVSSAHAYLTNERMPVCLDGNEEMEIDNARVLELKRTTKNNFHARGFVRGIVLEAPWQKNHHDHFAISIGPNQDDTLEIVYNSNREFGPMPRVEVGDEIVVCGDYITSFARSGRYDPSPQGALIHWVHYNPGNRDNVHEHGFIMFGNTLVGFDDAPRSAWDGSIPSRGGRSGRHQRGFAESDFGFEPQFSY